MWSDLKVPFYIIVVVGLLTGFIYTVSKVQQERSAKCFEQTKNVQCWGLRGY
jgi:hypothetical protein